MAKYKFNVSFNIPNSKLKHKELIPHLFRTEYRKIVAVLCKHFGLAQIEVAEDIASDTFLSAAQIWGLEGLPKNPTAWLYLVAKNKTSNYLQREQLFQKKIAPELNSSLPQMENEEIDLSAQNISDSQLQMMFAICHPSISPEAQIGLSLRLLCGFGIEEIADAFLTNKETINKRLFRAKQTLREEKINIELPDASAIDNRLGGVLSTIYLLFNEGYYSTSQEQTIRKELCLEAIRLCQMLVENSATDRPAANALLALLCFQASRLDARKGEDGELILYEDQDTRLWSKELISKGAYFLNRSASGDEISKYHLEASIAYWNTQKTDSPEKWQNILRLYNQLLRIAYSPITALNRTYALSKVEGKKIAIIEAEKLRLINNHFYYTLLGELYNGIDSKKARDNFELAISIAKTETDRATIQKKIDSL